MGKKRASSKKTPATKALHVFVVGSRDYSDDLPTTTIRKITDALDQAEFTTSWVIFGQELKPGDARAVEKELAACDALLFILSRNSSRSEAAIQAFAAIAFGDIAKERQRLLVARLDDADVPSYFADRLVVDLFPSFNRGVEQLIEALGAPPSSALVTTSRESQVAQANEVHIGNLQESLRQGRLTLFCGAGVSVEAGIPAWDTLLVKLLGLMMQKLSHQLSLDVLNAATKFKERNGASPLILGKYLKNTLGDEFASKLRDALYESNPVTCDLVDSVIRLSRPQRDGRPLDSIVTFNFDCLVEEQLAKSGIPNKAIYSETIDHSSNEIPIYHVHGFLPRNGPVDRTAALVFSEDAYHSQFIDPFSWSNLIQLNKLTQTTCLLVGLSLTDPNMRRLLDVAWRKNPGQAARHYILKRLPQPEPEGEVLDKVSQVLEEQDANALGLNVIWFKKFSDVPKILNRIITVK